MLYKVCPRCGKVRWWYQFNKNKVQRHHLSCWCKFCNREYSKRYPHTKEYMKEYYANNRERSLLNTVVRRQTLKEKVLRHYGNGKLACVRCGFKDIRSLSIDHIGGDGNKHRRELGQPEGLHIYEWLKTNGYPKGFQTLCMNCQFIKRIENKEMRRLIEP